MIFMIKKKTKPNVLMKQKIAQFKLEFNNVYN